MEVATGLLQHAMDVAHCYKQNMAMHHGLEKPERIVLDPLKIAQQQKPPEAVKPLPIVEAKPPESPPASKPSAASTIAPWLMAASLATGGAGLGAAAATWLAKPQPATPLVLPSNPPPGEDHLLSDLQERGYHLSPKGGKR